MMGRFGKTSVRQSYVCSSDERVLVSALHLYSTLEGVLYMSIMNLASFHRNLYIVILIGVIPVPNKPKNIINTLSPLVEELLQLWKGAILKN